MGRKRLDMGKESQTRRVIQKNIRERYSEEVIQTARERLCKRCNQNRCFLLPICLDGKDCPYFKEKESGV